MFVRSIRMNTLKLFGIALLAVFAIVMLFIFIPSHNSGTVSETIKFDKMKTDSDRIAFLFELGYTVEESPLESVEVTIPDDFDKVFAAYNELQKSMGLDLGRYKGKRVMRYTYKVTNYEGYSEDVYANLLVYKNKIIGGDICSADPHGFAHGLVKGM